MSIQKITPDNVEFFSIETNPSKSYSSRPRRNEFGGKMYFTGAFGNPEPILDNTGSIHLYAIRSPTEKETISLGSRTSYEDHGFEQLRRSILEITSSTNINSHINTYLSVVNETSASLRKQQKLEIIRFTPTFNFTSNTIRKNLIVDHLMPYYRTVYPSAHFGYANYNSLHFFSSGSSSTDFPVPDSSVLLYPNPSGSEIETTNTFESDYGIGNGQPFSFDFWIKPKYTVDDGFDYKAGTILHLSSAYAVSIHSGSSKDENGRPNKFKVMLQLGSGSGLPPSQDNVDPAFGVFMSNDNVLNFNEWSHVTIRFSGDSYNNATGSFIINGSEEGNFYIEDPSFSLYSPTASLAPYALCVGNFYEGPNELDLFFNLNSATRDGLLQMNASTDEPSGSQVNFSHPLNAELHDLKIYNKYLTTTEIKELDLSGPKTLDNLKFYLPPFFTVESPYRSFVGTFGGELITPFFEKDGTTTTPFGAEMAFGCGGFYPNLENYVRDFATGRYPRLWLLTGSSQTPGNNIIETANDFLYSSGSNVGSVKKRLYTILPCDHGNWQPSFELLSNMSGAFDGRYSNDLYNFTPGLVSLRDIVSDIDTLGSRTIGVSGSILDDVLGVGPEAERLATDPGLALTMLHRLRDPSSNQVTVFDISNLFYGKQIKPGSIVLTDPYLSASDNKFGMVLKDDGLGNLYRADAKGEHAKWATIGNIFYNEGLVFIKHPNLFFFGQEGFDISFRGIQSIHTYTVNAFARPLQLISSSNPDFIRLESNSTLNNEPDQNFVYITGINLHDENLNVIVRSALAQPIVKRSSDKLLFKVKLDY